MSGGGNSDYVPIPQGRNVLGKLSRSTRLYLMTVGGTTYDGVLAKQDRAALHMILGAGFSQSDALTTFTMSSRGRHAAERLGDYFPKYAASMIRGASPVQLTRERRQTCLRFLREILIHGPVKSTHVRIQARDAKIPIRQLREVRREFEVGSQRIEGIMHWMPSRKLYYGI